MKTALALVVMLLGLGFALNSASCIQSACTTSSGGSGGSAGTGGAGGTDCVSGATAGADAGTMCPQLTALQACLTAFCASGGPGVGTPFCGCYATGYDLAPQSTDSSSCMCIQFFPAQFCTQAAATGATADSYADCSSVTSPLISMCVGVTPGG